MKHLILIGLPGSGKTTVGRLAAERLGLPFSDCDTLIEVETGLRIPAIFAQQGESGFRAVESRILAALLREDTRVIATGGGVVESAENRRLLRESGVVVLLDRDIRQIAGCVGNRERPLLKQYTLEQLARRRRDWYLDCADTAIGSVGTAEQLAAQAAEIWRNA